jgi:hypothetical protein
MMNIFKYKLALWSVLAALMVIQPAFAEVNAERLAYFENAHGQKLDRDSRNVKDLNGKSKMQCTKNGYVSNVENMFEDRYTVEIDNKDHEVDIAAVECTARGRNAKTGMSNGLGGSHMQLNVKIDGKKKYNIEDFYAGEFFIHTNRLFVVEQECCGGAKYYSTYDVMTGQPVETDIKIGARSDE